MIGKIPNVATGAAVGAGGGAAVGALSALFREKPTLKKAMQSALLGGAGGAVVGSAVGAASDSPTPADETNLIDEPVDLHNPESIRRAVEQIYKNKGKTPPPAQ